MYQTCTACAEILDNVNWYREDPAVLLNKMTQQKQVALRSEERQRSIHKEILGCYYSPRPLCHVSWHRLAPAQENGVSITAQVYNTFHCLWWRNMEAWKDEQLPKHAHLVNLEKYKVILILNEDSCSHGKSLAYFIKGKSIFMGKVWLTL